MHHRETGFQNCLIVYAKSCVQTQSSRKTYLRRNVRYVHFVLLLVEADLVRALKIYIPCLL